MEARSADRQREEVGPVVVVRVAESRVVHRESLWAVLAISSRRRLEILFAEVPEDVRQGSLLTAEQDR